MSNRIVIGEFYGEQVIRVAKPGYNALDPNLTVDKLIFDSRWQSVGRILLSGKAFFPSTYNQTVTVDVPFGMVLKKPPFGFILTRSTDDNGGPVGGYYGGWAATSALCLQDRLRFTAGGNNSASFAQDIRYFVMTV